MKIQCLIKRASGTSVEMDGEVYVFNDENEHVCDVANKIHVERLLSITEAYVPAATKRPSRNRQAPPPSVEESVVEDAPEALSFVGNNDEPQQSKPASKRTRRSRKEIEGDK